MHLQGNATLVNKSWKINGQGIQDAEDYRYEGEFKDELVHGSGKVYLKKENRWYKATAVSGKLTYDEPLK